MAEKFDKTAYDVKYYKATYQQVKLSIRKDSEIWDALQECKAHTGVPYAAYALKALENQLRKDGYLSTNP